MVASTVTAKATTILPEDSKTLLLLEVGVCGLPDLEEQMILQHSLFVNRKDLDLRALKAGFPF